MICRRPLKDVAVPCGMCIAGGRDVGDCKDCGSYQRFDDEMYEEVTSTTYYGNDILAQQVENTAACASLCNDRSDCVAFSTKAYGKDCWLKHSLGTGPPTANREEVSYIKQSCSSSDRSKGGMLKGMLK